MVRSIRIGHGCSLRGCPCPFEGKQLEPSNEPLAVFSQRFNTSTRSREQVEVVRITVMKMKPAERRASRQKEAVFASEELAKEVPLKGAQLVATG